MPEDSIPVAVKRLNAEGARPFYVDPHVPDAFVRDPLSTAPEVEGEGHTIWVANVWEEDGFCPSKSEPDMIEPITLRVVGRPLRRPGDARGRPLRRPGDARGRPQPAQHWRRAMINRPTLALLLSDS